MADHSSSTVQHQLHDAGLVYADEATLLAASPAASYYHKYGYATAERTYWLWTQDGWKLLLHPGNAISKLATVTGVDMKSVASTTLLTVPAGKTLYVTGVLIRDPSASMAGGTDYDFTNWKQTVDLSSLTTLGTDYIFLDGNNTKYTETAAAANFQITVVTGTTAACTATIDVFGFLA